MIFNPSFKPMPTPFDPTSTYFSLFTHLPLTSPPPPIFHPKLYFSFSHTSPTPLPPFQGKSGEKKVVDHFGGALGVMPVVIDYPPTFIRAVINSYLFRIYAASAGPASIPHREPRHFPRCTPAKDLLPPRRHPPCTPSQL